jgi:putative transposase
MNSVLERCIGSCRRETAGADGGAEPAAPNPVLREYEDFCSTHRPHRALNQAAPLRPLPDGVTDLDPLWAKRRHRAGRVNHEYRLVA